MIKGKLSLFIIFSLIIGLTGATGAFLAINMSKSNKIIKEKLEFVIEKSEDTEKKYDGSPLELKSIELAEGYKLPSGYTYDFICNDTITNVGTIYPNPNIIIYDNYGKNVSSHYDCVIKDNGGLKVTPRSIHVSYDSAEKPYDGTPLNTTTFTVDNGALALGQKISPEYLSEVTTIEEGKVKIEAKTHVLDINGTDVTDNYFITDNLSGDDIPTFEIRGNKLVIYTKNAEFTYDGLAHSYKEIDFLGDLIPGHRIIVNESTAITNVADSGKNIIDPDNIDVLDADGVSVRDKYGVTVVNQGIITIKPYTLVLETSHAYSIQVEYNGDVHQFNISDDDIAAMGLLKQKDLDLLGEFKLTAVAVDEVEARTYPLELNITDNYGNTTDNFEIDPSYRNKLYFEITKRNVEIKKKDNAVVTKQYTGRNLFEAYEIYEAKDSAFTYDISFKEDLEFIDKGIYNVTSEDLVIRVEEGTLSNENFNFEIDDIKLTIIGEEPIEFDYIVDSSKTYQKTYDGEELLATDIYCLTKNSLDFLDSLGYSCTFEFATPIIDAGTYTRSDLALNVEIRDELGRLVSGIGAYNPDTLTIEIKKMEFSVKTGSKTKVYDGTPLYCMELEAIGLPEGFTIVASPDKDDWASRVNVGTTDNDEFTFSIFDKNGVKVKSSNYRTLGGSSVYGTLTITQAVLNIYMNNKTITYGDEIDVQKLTFTVSGNGTEIAIDPNITPTIIDGTIISAVCTLDSNNCLVRVYNGELTINKKKLYIDTSDETKEYDGTPLYNLDISFDGLVSGDELNIISGSQITNVGSVQNKLVVGIFRDGYEDVTNYYDIDYRTMGTLTITKKIIIVRTNDIVVDLTGGDSIYNHARTYSITDINNMPIDQMIYYIEGTFVDVTEVVGKTINNTFIITSFTNYEIIYMYGEIEFV